MLSRPIGRDSLEGVKLSNVIKLVDKEYSSSQKSSITFKRKLSAEEEEEEVEEEEEEEGEKGGAAEIKALIDKPCSCGRRCLSQLKESEHNYERPVKIIQKKRFLVNQLGRNNNNQRKDALRPFFDESVLAVGESGRYVHNFFLRDENFIADGLCRESWAAAYGVTPNMVETLSKEKKSGKQLFTFSSLVSFISFLTSPYLNLLSG